MKFNEKIVRLRKIRGITQDEFASAVGVSRQAVYKWESGQSYPEVAKLLEIKMLFNISIDDLLDDNFEIAMPEKKKRKRPPKPEAKKVVEEVKSEVEAYAPKEEPVKAEEPVSAIVAEPVSATVEEPVSATVEEPVSATVEEAVSATVEEAVSATVEEAVSATVEEVVAEPVAESAVAPAVETDEKEEAPVTASEPVEAKLVNAKEELNTDEKKRGFFGRLFGRK